MVNHRVKPESPGQAGRSDLTLVDILVALTHLTLENGSSKRNHLFGYYLIQTIPLDMIVPEATVNYVAAVSGVTASERK
jgi:hypothetical protein